MSEYDVYLDAADIGPVIPHEEGGWPTFQVTLTYHVGSEDRDAEPDIVEAQKDAKAFFAAAEFPQGFELA